MSRKICLVVTLAFTDTEQGKKFSVLNTLYVKINDSKFM